MSFKDYMKKIKQLIDSIDASIPSGKEIRVGYYAIDGVNYIIIGSIENGDYEYVWLCNETNPTDMMFRKVYIGKTPNKELEGYLLPLEDEAELALAMKLFLTRSAENPPFGMDIPAPDFLNEDSAPEE